MKSANLMFTADRLRPYMSGGENVLFYTNTIGDTFVGGIASIVSERNGHSLCRISIRTKWLQMIREVDESGGLDTNWDPVGDIQTEYVLAFERPKLIKVRSPLTFTSNGEKVEISHVTRITKIALSIRSAISASLPK